MAKLRYVGPAPGPDRTLPLPEGWPAADHDEPDPVVAEAKVQSGLYKRARRERPAQEQEVTDGGD